MRPYTRRPATACQDTAAVTDQIDQSVAPHIASHQAGYGQVAQPALLLLLHVHVDLLSPCGVRFRSCEGGNVQTVVVAAVHVAVTVVSSPFRWAGLCCGEEGFGLGGVHSAAHDLDNRGRCPFSQTVPVKFCQQQNKGELPNWACGSTKEQRV